MKTKLKKILSMLLTMAMIVSMITVMSSADEVCKTLKVEECICSALNNDNESSTRNVACPFGGTHFAYGSNEMYYSGSQYFNGSWGWRSLRDIRDQISGNTYLADLQGQYEQRVLLSNRVRTRVSGGSQIHKQAAIFSASAHDTGHRSGANVDSDWVNLGNNTATFSGRAFA